MPIPPQMFASMLGLRRVPLFSRQIARIARRRYTTKPPPQPQGEPARKESKGLSANFYRSFGSPILKTFLGALFTYQVIYWGWLKLEMLDIQREKNDEIKQLQREVTQAKHEARIKRDTEENRKTDVTVEGVGSQSTSWIDMLRGFWR
ncbi:hypothetical protein CC78DRAFT_620713 [Lojkania enalia]|uniref:Uncharacterized protein n=1 Tax=Lojkania enalia TaxID=147567 RepID=A0A9P4N5T4_9PLEO|nr:hypothetical protein CC78DRAFT_620713 [Didymosphaeria enalia]